MRNEFITEHCGVIFNLNQIYGHCGYFSEQDASKAVCDAKICVVQDEFDGVILDFQDVDLWASLWHLQLGRDDEGRRGKPPWGNAEK